MKDDLEIINSTFFLVNDGKYIEDKGLEMKTNKGTIIYLYLIRIKQLNY